MKQFSLLYLFTRLLVFCTSLYHSLYILASRTTTASGTTYGGRYSSYHYYIHHVVCTSSKCNGRIGGVDGLPTVLPLLSRLSPQINGHIELQYRESLYDTAVSFVQQINGGGMTHTTGSSSSQQQQQLQLTAAVVELHTRFLVYSIYLLSRRAMTFLLLFCVSDT